MQTLPVTESMSAPTLAPSAPFADLGLISPLLLALVGEGYTTPTPIQQQSIPHVLASRDLVGCAQTGTGKTAAFALPILQLLSQKPRVAARRAPPRVLVLSPTRELAAQIGESFRTYGKNLRLTHEVIFGGVGQSAQERALSAGVDVLVATPGRLLDLMQQRLVDLSQVEIFVLDEADRMLDMGFLPDVRRVIQKIPSQRQTLLFSATFPRDIEELARTILRDPVRVEVTPEATTAEKIKQSVYFVDKADKKPLLQELLNDGAITRALVFTRTKHGANRVAEQLEKAGVAAAAIHGNKSQNARERALEGFRAGSLRVLVATDIAARGIDVEGVSHVVNYDLPNVPESYVHRIGRTARAGAEGIAISFCDQEERTYLVDIEKIIRQRVPRVEGHSFIARAPADAPARSLPPPPPEHRGGGGGGRGRSGGRGGPPRGGQDHGRPQAQSRGPAPQGGRGPSPMGRGPAPQGRGPAPQGRGPAPQGRGAGADPSPLRVDQAGVAPRRREHTGDVPSPGPSNGRVQGWAGGRRPNWPTSR